MAPDLEAEVARHWHEATTRPGASTLFNGRIFCADRITPRRIEGHWTEYRRIVAQMADPSLFTALAVRSLAVCGVLCCPDGIVIGRREPGLLYQPGLWQLPPAGSVDHGSATPDGADWRRAIEAELQEELGLPRGCVAGMRPFCLVQHPTGVIDMGIRIDTPMSGAEIVARHRTLGDGEYDALLVLPQVSLLSTLAAQGSIPVPGVELLLGLLPPA